MGRGISRAAWALPALAMLAPARLARAEDETVFIELEDRSQALPAAVNDNGSILVGNFNGGDGFYWMPTTGVIFIGGKLASGVSADGATIVGTAYGPGRIENAAIWLRAAEWRLLGSFPGAVPCDFNLSSATGTSRDGSVVVGFAYNGCTMTRAFRWQESTGMVDLGSSVPGQYSQALAVSGDGTLVVGAQEAEFGNLVGARWRDGRQELFAGPIGPVGTARTTNGDGSIVGGRQCRPGDELDQSAWIWTASEGVVCLPPPALREHQLVVATNVFATSDDGRVMGGAQVAGGTTDQEAVIWINRSVAYLKDFLRANGVPNAFATWINTGEITDITPDGRILVGYGAALGGFRGYMVILGSNLVMP
jgi:probable HAF family extracellular repeat protein